MTAGGEIDSERFLLRSGQIRVAGAIGGAIVSGGGDHALSLAGPLFQDGVERRVVARSEFSLAVSIAGANDRSDPGVDCVVD